MAPWLLERTRHSVATDAPEVHRHEEARDQRKEDAVQDVESKQRMRSDFGAAKQERARIVDRIDPQYLMERSAVTQERRGARHVRAHRNCPNRKLIPRQQVAGE